ncbi:hypothetical protein ACS5PN_23690 [Roseateles sp. NT4]|uniref:hypothetical protein n=1 Tax=Roseateles sp. NT4 TaxID=3453715 RepID=UPI003EEC858F
MSFPCWESTRRFNYPLCRRYTVVRFGWLGIPTRNDCAADTHGWHWALGSCADGQSEVLGAWRDEGPATSLLIAADFHDRGLERVDLFVGDDRLVAAMRRFCTAAVGRLASTASSRRMRQTAHVTDAVAQLLQERLLRLAPNRRTFGDAAAEATFIERALQRVGREFLDVRWSSIGQTPYGVAAPTAALSVAV